MVITQHRNYLEITIGKYPLHLKCKAPSLNDDPTLSY